MKFCTRTFHKIVFAHRKFGLIRKKGNGVKRGFRRPPPRSERVFEIPAWIESLARKIYEKAESTNAKLDDILLKLRETEKRIDSVEEKVPENTDEIEDLKQSMEFMDNTIE